MVEGFSCIPFYGLVFTISFLALLFQSGLDKKFSFLVEIMFGVLSFFVGAFFFQF